MNRFGTVIGLLTAVVVICCAGAAAKFGGHIEAESITLKSPNGRYRVVMQAKDAGAFLWVVDSQSGATSYLTVNDHESPHLAATTNGSATGGAYVAADRRGGVLQLADERRKVTQYSAAEFAKLFGGDFN